MANKIKFNRLISDIDRTKAMSIYEIVCEQNIELLVEADEIEEQKLKGDVSEKSSKEDDHGITMDLLQNMVNWDKRRRVLKDWQWNVMNDIVTGKKDVK